jgi:hypothetical protein
MNETVDALLVIGGGFSGMSGGHPAQAEAGH